MNHRIYPRTVAKYRDSFEVRWFLEVQTMDGRWHDIGSSTERSEMYARLANIEVVGNSWRDRVPPF
jgi:hypothetical protein